MPRINPRGGSPRGIRHGPTVSPWALTPEEARVMDAVVTTGTNKGAANLLGKHVKTIEQMKALARFRIGERHMLHAIIKWHDWRKAEARTVRAEDGAGDGVVLRALSGIGELERAMRPHSERTANAS